ncbi:exported protein of unknown function [Magnetospira sp. QH-2]|nr:exported protein of unknown function [Magnetospira sp. QH-2]
MPLLICLWVILPGTAWTAEDNGQESPGNRLYRLLEELAAQKDPDEKLVKVEEILSVLSNNKTNHMTPFAYRGVALVFEEQGYMREAVNAYVASVLAAKEAINDGPMSGHHVFEAAGRSITSIFELGWPDDARNAAEILKQSIPALPKLVHRHVALGNLAQIQVQINDREGAAKTYAFNEELIMRSEGYDGVEPKTVAYSATKLAQYRLEDGFEEQALRGLARLEAYVEEHPEIFIGYGFERLITIPRAYNRKVAKQLNKRLGDLTSDADRSNVATLIGYTLSKTDPKEALAAFRVMESYAESSSDPRTVLKRNAYLSRWQCTAGELELSKRSADRAIQGLKSADFIELFRENYDYTKDIAGLLLCGEWDVVYPFAKAYVKSNNNVSEKLILDDAIYMAEKLALRERIKLLRAQGIR